MSTEFDDRKAPQTGRDTTPLRELGGVCAHDVRFVVQHLLESLGVNETVRPFTAQMVLEHGLERLGLELQAFADLLGEAHEHYEVLMAIRDRARLLGSAGYLLAQLHASGAEAANHG